MKELGLILLCIQFARQIQAQVPLANSMSQQDINSLFRAGQGFPGQIERTFFLTGSPPKAPQLNPQPKPAGSKVGQWLFGGSNPEMFTIDKHIQMPAQSITGSRGSKKWKFESSSQKHTETDSQMAALKDASLSQQEGQTGAISQKPRPGGIDLGATQFSRESKLDVTGKRDRGVEGKAEIRQPVVHSATKEAADLQAGNMWELARGAHKATQAQTELSKKAVFDRSGQTPTKIGRVVPRHLFRGSNLEVRNLWGLDSGKQEATQGQAEVPKQTQLNKSAKTEITLQEGRQLNARGYLLQGANQAGIAKPGHIAATKETVPSYKAERRVTRHKNLDALKQTNLFTSGQKGIAVQEADSKMPASVLEAAQNVLGGIPSGRQTKLVYGAQPSIKTEHKIEPSPESRIVGLIKELGVSSKEHADSSQLDTTRKEQTEAANKPQNRRDVHLRKVQHIDAKRDKQVSATFKKPVGASHEALKGFGGEGHVKTFPWVKDASQLDIRHKRQQGISHESQLAATKEAQLDRTGDAKLDSKRDVLLGTKSGDASGSSIGTSGQTQLSVPRGRQLDVKQEAEAHIGLSREAQLKMIRKGQLGITGGRQLDALPLDQARTKANVVREAQTGLEQARQLDLSRRPQSHLSKDQLIRINHEPLLGQKRLVPMVQMHGTPLDASNLDEIGVTREAQLNRIREAQLGLKREGELGVTRDVNLGVSHKGQFGAAREAKLSTSRETELGLSQEGKLGMAREAQLGIKSKRQLSFSPEKRTGLAPGVLHGLTRTGKIDITKRTNVEKANNVMQGEAQTWMSRKGQTGSLGRHSDFLDLSGQTEGPLQTIDRQGIISTFPEMSGNLGDDNLFETSRVSVNIKCYVDSKKGLICGLEQPDGQCKEKWDFPNPCTRKNLDMNITKFVHPYDTSKFLMCGEMGKLYIVQCPQRELLKFEKVSVYEEEMPQSAEPEILMWIEGSQWREQRLSKAPIFHPGCGQCVVSTVGLTDSCEEPLTPQVSNPCTRKNIIENKLFFPFPGNLTKYIHCDVWGKPWERICTTGEVWSQAEVSCVLPSLLNPCARMNTDLAYFYPHPCDRSRYLRCDSNGAAYVTFCDFGEAFNEATQRCHPIGSFIGSDEKEFCENILFGFKPYRAGLGLPDKHVGPTRPAITKPQGVGQVETPAGKTEKVVSKKDGTLAIHESKLKEYIFKSNEAYAEPCTLVNIKAGRYHFMVKGEPHSFIQCDTFGRSHKMPCSSKGRDWFDPWTNTCVDGPVFADYEIKGSRGFPKATSKRLFRGLN